MTRFAFLASACLVLTSCATVVVNAPRGRAVALLSDEPAPVKIVTRNWYLLWGLVPLTNNSTAGMIGQVNLTGVRVKTYFRPADFLANILLAPLSLHTNTVVIEGRGGRY